MSAVFMCDSCGELFSVNQTGWREFTETGHGKGFNNAYNHGARTRHVGPCCNLSDGNIVKPRLAITEK